MIQNWSLLPGLQWDSALSLLSAQVQSLVGELISHKKYSTATKKKKNKMDDVYSYNFVIFNEKYVFNKDVCC